MSARCASVVVLLCSPYTMCPLPPPENRIEAAVAAGMKRHPTARGFEG